MIDIQKIAREANVYAANQTNDSYDYPFIRDERFAALYREAVVQELVAGSGEPVAYRTEDSTNGVNVWLFKKTAVKYQDPPDALYTADQLAGAVLRERERCAKVCDETVAHHYMKQTIPTADEALLVAACSDCAAAIRSGE